MWEGIKNNKVETLKADILRLKHEVSVAIAFVEKLSAEEQINLELEDTLGDSELIKSLVRFQDKFQNLSQKEREQNWVNIGLARFVSILRIEGKSSEVLFSDIVSSLVKYVDANQAGIFVLNMEKKLELKACYAYNRKKMLTKTIELGEGLLGQCFLEGETMFLTDLPDQFTEITSGLGAATPSNLLLVPLKIDMDIVGVLEIASFKRFKKFEISFIEKLCENVAIVVKQDMAYIKMQQLLSDAEHNKEVMMAQEEEMRQQMEELQSTQEDILRKEKETKTKFDTLKLDHLTQVQEIQQREIELKKQKEILMNAISIDNILIDIAGRNRMLSQKIGFLCQMIHSGKTQFIKALNEAIQLHDISLKVIKDGGKAPGISTDFYFPVADEMLFDTITSVEQMWGPFKEMALTFVCLTSSQENKETALEHIESNGLELLTLNNDLVLKCIEYNKKKLMNSGLMQM